MKAYFWKEGRCKGREEEVTWNKKPSRPALNTNINGLTYHLLNNACAHREPAIRSNSLSKAFAASKHWGIVSPVRE